MTFADHVISYHKSISPDWKLPRGFEIIYPFGEEETWKAFSAFYKKYFSDQRSRTFLFGINPGRFGAGVTGIPFTDPKILEEDHNIDNPFQKRNELSSIFIHKMIMSLGGPEVFYLNFYITSVCVLGFLKDNKNINYYDDKKLEKILIKKIVENIETQVAFGCHTDVAYSIGKGKNFHFLKALNDKHQFFKEVKPLPHPRWVLQYRRKTKDVYVLEYRDTLLQHLE